jgi:RNA polymerase sigma-70 factor (ECF subfamily)
MTILIVNREITLLGRAGDEATEASSSLMDEQTFRAFYERTSRALWVYLSRITGEPQAVEDLLQETYYRFYRAGSDYESESHRRNSLFRIATNLARDVHRRRHGVVTTELQEFHLVTPERRAEERTDLERGLAQLSPKQREMLWLAYAYGSSHDEIAEVVGVAPGSVKGLLRRARMKLAGFLSPERGTAGGAKR